MQHLAYAPEKRNYISTSIEFSNSIIDFSASSRGPVTTAGQYLQRRYAICPELADVVAALAGLGVEEARR